MFGRKPKKTFEVMVQTGDNVPSVEFSTRFKTVICDCPWRYQNWTNAANGAAVSAMSTMSKEEIIALKSTVSAITDKDCVMLFWTTWPKLEEAYEVVKEWGFQVISACPWIKTTPNTGQISTGIGFWFQSTSEILLVVRKGKPTSARDPAVLGLLCGSERQFYAKKNKHSQKPKDMHEYAEMKLEGPYLELFAREKRDNWACIGYDLGYAITPQGIKRVETQAKEPVSI